jgi:hypothetical protein
MTIKERTFQFPYDALQRKRGEVHLPSNCIFNSPEGAKKCFYDAVSIPVRDLALRQLTKVKYC